MSVEISEAHKAALKDLWELGDTEGCLAILREYSLVSQCETCDATSILYNVIFELFNEI